MTLLREREIVRRAPLHLEMAIGILGILVSALGSWMFLASETAELTIFGWSWELGALEAGWSLGTLTGGGLLMALGFGVMAYRRYRHDGTFTASSYLALAGSLLGVASAVVFALVAIF